MRAKKRKRLGREFLVRFWMKNTEVLLQRKMILKKPDNFFLPNFFRPTIFCSKKSKNFQKRRRQLKKIGLKLFFFAKPCKTFLRTRSCFRRQKMNKQIKHEKCIDQKQAMKFYSWPHCLLLTTKIATFQSLSKFLYFTSIQHCI